MLPIFGVLRSDGTTIMKRFLGILTITIIIMIFVCGAVAGADADAEITAFEGYFVIELNDGYPDFTVKDLTTQPYDVYSELDDLGRAGTAMACIGRESFPKEQRSSIEEIIPSGWNNAYYDFVDDGYIYNRCHLIGNQLTGNDTPNNIITGTHYLNIEGMLPYENWVTMYVSNTGNHVLYRVTPLYEGDNLVASAVQMEGYSVEDFGAGICFNVLIYNIQPGIAIDYSNGDNWQDDSVIVAITETFEDTETESIEALGEQEVTYILNTSSHKFHYPYCDSVIDMKEKNKAEFYGTRDEAIAQGYEPCGRCNP